MDQTKKEKEESNARRMKNGTISVIDAIMDEHGVDRDEAIQIKIRIDEDKARFNANTTMLNTLSNMRLRSAEQETDQDA